MTLLTLQRREDVSRRFVFIACCQSAYLSCPQGEELMLFILAARQSHSPAAVRRIREGLQGNLYNLLFLELRKLPNELPSSVDVCGICRRRFAERLRFGHCLVYVGRRVLRRWQSVSICSGKRRCTFCRFQSMINFNNLNACGSQIFQKNTNKNVFSSAHHARAISRYLHHLHNFFF